MTTPRPRTLDEWSRHLALNPRLEDESVTDWFARVTDLANAKEDAPPAAASLPYREPGGDDD